MTRPATAGYRLVLRHREFRALALAQTISGLGTIVASVALAVLVFERTASPLLSALTFTLGFTPYLLGGFIAPRFERVPPRRLMICCDLFQGAVYVAMAVPGLPVAALLGLLALASVAAPVFGGTRAALLPELLGEGDGYVLGRSILRLIMQSAQVVGLALGGALLLVVPARDALLIDAATFAASAVLIRLRLRERPPTPVASTTPTRGLGPVFADPHRRRLLVLGWLVPMAAVASEALATPYVVSLGHPAGTAGLLLWAAPAGSVVGEVVTVRLLGEIGRVRAVLPLAVVVLAAPIGFALGPSLGVAAGLMFASGAGFGYPLGLDRLLLDATPSELRRRVLSVSGSGLMFWQGLGFGIAGAAAEFAPVTTVVPLISVAGLLGLLLMSAALRGAGRDSAQSGSTEMVSQ